MKRSAAICFISFMMIAIGGWSPLPAASAAVTNTYTTVADSYVDQSSPGTNYGSSNPLEVSAKTGAAQIAYYKFTVSNAPSPVALAKLRVYTGGDLIGDLVCYSVTDNSWDESTLNYTNRPALNNLLVTLDEPGARKWVEFDVSSAIAGNGTYSFAIKSSNVYTGGTIDSRESSNAPVLVLSDSSTATPTITIDANQVLGTVSKGIFGNNHRYPDGGYGVLDIPTQTIKQDIIDWSKDFGITGLRFPGGTVGNDYVWEDGIGPVANRPAGYEYGIMEHMQLVEAIGQDAIDYVVITLRREHLTSQEAADFVEFCNAPNDGSNPNGGTDWAAVRASYGHPQPYGIKHWVIGNEVSGSGTAAQPYTNIATFLDGKPGTFWEGALAIRDAMKAVDPTILVGTGWKADDQYAALQSRQTTFDFFDKHLFIGTSAGSTTNQKHYQGVASALKSADWFVETKKKMEPYSYVAGTPTLQLEATSGQNSDAIKMGLGHALTNAIGLQKDIEYGVTWQFHLQYSSGSAGSHRVDNAYEHLQFSSDYSNWYESAPAFPYKLFAKRLGRNYVQTTFLNVPHVNVSSAVVNKMYAIAGKDDSGNTLDLIVTNADADLDHTVSINVLNYTPASSAQVWEGNGASIVDKNSFANPHEVGIAVKPDITNASGSFTYTFPAHSVTAIRFTNNQALTPAGYWKLDETTGTIAHDSSGNGHDGDLVNAAAWTASGKINGAIALDGNGNDDYVSVPNIVNPSSGNFTAAAWVKLDAAAGSVNQIIVQQEGTNGRTWLSRDTSTGKLSTYLGNAKLVSNTVLQLGNWYHVLVERNGNVVKLYINGQFETSATRSVESSAGKMRIGLHKSPSSNSEEWDGAIDEVRIYYSALSDSDILQLYQSQ